MNEVYPEWITSELVSETEPVFLYTADEVAPMFRVADSTVLTWVRQGRMRAIRTPGKALRIPHTEIRRLRREAKERDDVS